MFEHLRIGLTMRRSDACDYLEPRDGIARSWFVFLQQALPDSVYVALPNVGNEFVRIANSLGLNAFILTGGESPGDYPERDECENTLISYALQKDLPVMGVCRGLQMLHAYFGGKLISCPNEEHVAVQHDVFFNENPFWSAGRQRVNSYHKNVIEVQALFEEFQPLALDSAGRVEGVFSTEHRLAGIMWHPERENIFAEPDITIFRKFFA